MSLTVLHQDDALVAILKPPGCETIVEGTGGACLSTEVRAAIDPALRPVHRLDRDTSGVQLFARTEAARASLEQAFRERRTTKRYLALCLGIPRNPTGSINRPLSKWQGGRRPVQALKGRQGLTAETDYTRLTEARETAAGLALSLLSFQPHQGRTHQIRVHAAAFGYPVLGDDQYGDRAANQAIKNTTGLKRQALHAWRLTVPHPDDGTPITFEAPLLPDMLGVCALLLPDWHQALAHFAGTL